MNRVVKFDPHHARESENDASRLEHGEDGAVLEIELDSDDLLAVSQPRSLGKQKSNPEVGDRTPVRPLVAAEAPLISLSNETPSNAKRGPALVGIAIGAPTLIAAVVTAFIAYHGTGWTEPMDTSAMPSAPHVTALATRPQISEPVRPAVRFTNPFDRAEIFEFPAGTSLAEARGKVADLLTKRAQERRKQARERVAMAHQSGASRR